MSYLPKDKAKIHEIYGRIYVYGRIPVDYAPMQDLLIDIKTMPQAFGGYHLLLMNGPIT